MSTTARKRIPVDKVTQRVVGGALDSIAREMGWALYRMAYSSIIRESEDLGAGIFSADGKSICESDSTPMQLGALSCSVRGILSVAGGNVEEGDVFIHNDPYKGVSHSSDICIVEPIFWKGSLVAFSANTAHWVDIGGAAPGINDDVVDIWAEGKIFSGLKLYRRGELNEELYRFILANVRTPDTNRGDLHAQLGSVRMGKRRFLELLERYGEDLIFSVAEEWMDYSERRLREEIGKLPDGEYRAEGWLDDDAKNRDKPLKIVVTVRVKGTDLEVDLTGSSPEVPTACNVPFEGSTKVAVYYAVRALLLDQARTADHVPQNDGIFRPISIVAPPGTIFNPRFPRACTSRFCQAQRLADLIIQALAPVIPEKVTASCSAAMLAAAYAIYDRDNGQYQVHVEVNEGSYGARYGADGLDGIDCHLANTRNTPIEELESHYALRTDRYELRDEEPAAGQWRGGIGIIRENRFLRDGVISTQGDRHYEPPGGLFGGEPGRVGALIKNPGTSKEVNLPAKVTAVEMKAGDVIRIVVPNSGGYGDPLKRAPERVLEDFLNGFISAETARNKYGVVLAGRHVDERQTASLREEMAKLAAAPHAPADRRARPQTRNERIS